MPLLVKIYAYESITDGEIDEVLTDEREEIHRLGDIKHILYCAEPSKWPVRSADRLSGHEWVTVYTGQNYHNGEYWRENIFLYHTNGKPLKPHQLYRVWKIAGIAK